MAGSCTEVETSYDSSCNCLRMTLPSAAVTEEIVVSFRGRLVPAANHVEKLVYDFLDQAEMEFDSKTGIYQLVCSGRPANIIIGELQCRGLSEDLVKCVTEFLTAK